ncbi:MAG: hypothetical protein ACJ0BN_11495 [Limisphaerales bacterium]
MLIDTIPVLKTSQTRKANVTKLVAFATFIACDWWLNNKGHSPKLQSQKGSSTPSLWAIRNHSLWGEGRGYHVL